MFLFWLPWGYSSCVPRFWKFITFVHWWRAFQLVGRPLLHVLWKHNFPSAQVQARKLNLFAFRTNQHFSSPPFHWICSPFRVIILCHRSCVDPWLWLYRFVTPTPSLLSLSSVPNGKLQWKLLPVPFFSRLSQMLALLDVSHAFLIYFWYI